MAEETNPLDNQENKPDRKFGELRRPKRMLQKDAPEPDTPVEDSSAAPAVELVFDPVDGDVPSDEADPLEMIEVDDEYDIVDEDYYTAPIVPELAVEEADSELEETPEEETPEEKPEPDTATRRRSDPEETKKKKFGMTDVLRMGAKLNKVTGSRLFLAAAFMALPFSNLWRAQENDKKMLKGMEVYEAAADKKTDPAYRGGVVMYLTDRENNTVDTQYFLRLDKAALYKLQKPERLLKEESDAVRALKSDEIKKSVIYRFSAMGADVVSAKKFHIDNEGKQEGASRTANRMVGYDRGMHAVPFVYDNADTSLAARTVGHYTDNATDMDVILIPTKKAQFQKAMQKEAWEKVPYEQPKLIH